MQHQTLFKHTQACLAPAGFLTVSLLCHIQCAILHPLLLLADFSRYQEKAFACLWAIGGVICAIETPESLTTLLSTSSGIILDVGPGSGHQVYRFTNVPAIKAIYGAEPGGSMHAALRNRAGKAGLADKYHVLHCEAKLESLVLALVQAGAIGSSAPTRNSAPFLEIVCIRILCGVDEPDAVIAGLYSILRPGGRMVVCEQVVNTGDGHRGGSRMCRILQHVYMWLGWKKLMGGCDLTRDTFASLRKVAERDGGLASVDVYTSEPYSTIPHIVGVLVKRGQAGDSMKGVW